MSAVAATLARRAMPWSCRAAVAVGSRDEALTWLDRVASGDIVGVRRREGVVLLCPGPGSQHVGMASALRDDPVFRDAWGACDAVVQEVLGTSLQPLVDGDKTGLDEIQWAQPAVFAVSWNRGAPMVPASMPTLSN